MQPENKNYSPDSQQPQEPEIVNSSAEFASSSDYSLSSNLAEPKKSALDNISIILSCLSLTGFAFSIYVYYDTKDDKFGGLAAGIVLAPVIFIFSINIVIFIAHVVKSRSLNGAVNRRAKLFILVAFLALAMNIIIPMVEKKIEDNKANKITAQLREESDKEDAQRKADAEKAFGYVEKYGFYFLSLDKTYRSLRTGTDPSDKPALVWKEKFSDYDIYNPHYGYNLQAVTQVVYLDQTSLSLLPCYGFTAPGTECKKTQLTFENYPVYSTQSSPREYVLTNGTIRISVHAETDTEAEERIGKLKKAEEGTLRKLLEQSEIDTPLLYKANKS